VPTKHQRIAVTKDGELEQALTEVASLFPGAPVARVVHDLAVRGAAALLEDERRRRDAIESLIAWSTDPNSDMDREALRNVKRVAWRI
jgi:hypothetical protein